MKTQRLRDAYRFTGFVPGHDVQSVITDNGARVIVLKRRQKKVCVPVATLAERSTTVPHGACVTFPAATFAFTSKSRCDGLGALGAKP